jgi:hypothetical protein
MTNLRTPLLQGLNLLGSDYHEKNQRHNRRCKRRPLIRDHDGFVLIMLIAHNRRMYTMYRRVGWFGNYLGKELQLFYL